jgi:hypothetical protein
VQGATAPHGLLQGGALALIGCDAADLVRCGTRLQQIHGDVLHVGSFCPDNTQLSEMGSSAPVEAMLGRGAPNPDQHFPMATQGTKQATDTIKAPLVLPIHILCARFWASSFFIWVITGNRKDSFVGLERAQGKTKYMKCTCKQNVLSLESDWFSFCAALQVVFQACRCWQCVLLTCSDRRC